MNRPAVCAAELFVVVVCASLPLACLSDSALPPDANVSCAANDECPRGYVCEAGRCEDAAGNRPPRLTVTAPARAAGEEVPLEITVFDPNADDVSLSAVVIDGTDPAVEVALDPSRIKASADGVTKSITAALPPLPSDALHGSLPRAVIVRVTAADATRSASAEATVLAGNEAPQVHALEIDSDAVDADGNAHAGGLVTVRFVLTDSSSDPVDITRFTVSAADGDHDVALDASGFPAGGTAGIATSPDGEEVVLTWDSATAPFAENVTLGIFVADAFGGEGEGHVSFVLDNAPRVGAPAVDDDALPGGVRAPGLGGPTDGSGAHAFAALPLVVALDDPNCAAGDETVALQVRFAVEDAASGGFGPLVDATLTPASDDLSAIDADDVEQAFAWDVAADVQGDALPAADVNAELVDAAPGVEAAARVPVRQRVKVSITARDSSTSALSSSADAVFVIGNDPPAVSMAPFTGVRGGDVAIAFSLSDSGADPSSVQIEFKRDASLPDDQFRPIAVRAGILDDLFVGPQPSSFLVLWDSLAEPNDANPRAPQGIGRALLPNAQLRIRAFDGPGAGVRHFSPWQVVDVSLSNQSKPRIEPVLVADQGGIRNGTVPIVYRVIDEESDPVNVVFEHSLDGVKFVTCTEAPTAQSEGTLSLASAPAAQGGVVHTFLWDTSSDIVGAQPSVRLRARAVDPFIDPTDDDAIPVFTLLQPAPFDPAPAAGAAGPFTLRTQALPADEFFTMDAGDIDDDGKDELVVGFQDTLGHARVFETDASGGLSFTRDIAGAQIANGGVHVKDVDGDGVADVFFDDGRWLRAPALTDAGLLTSPCASCRMTVADVDGDGVNDVVFVDESELDRVARVRFGAGVGAGWSATIEGNPASPVAVPSAFGEVPGVGDVDGDGLADFVINPDDGFPPVMRVFRASGSKAAGDVVYTLDGGAPLPVASDTLVLVDSDDDGDLDIVVNDDTAGILSLLDNDGTGAFTASDAVESVTFSGGIGIGDMNGDGTPDYALSTATEQALLVALGRPGGGFIASLRVATGDITFGAAVLDADGNGKDDVVTQIGLPGGPSAGAFGVALTGLSPLPAPSSVSAARAVLGGGAAQAAPLTLDADRDGALDFLMTVENGFPEVARGRRDGAVTTQWSLAYAGPQSHFSNIPAPKLVADVDGDGVGDVVAMGNDGAGTCNVQVWLGGKDADGVADGSFAAQPATGAPCTFADFAACDVDGDGAVDVVALESGARFTLLRGDGAGGLTPQAVDTALPVFLSAIACADFDRDGFDDVVATEDRSGNGAGSASAVSFRGSAGGLTSRAAFTYPVGAAWLRVADVDADGLIDVVAVPGNTDAGEPFHVLHTNGVAAGAALSFTAQAGQGATPPGAPRAPVLADVDLDGALDMAFVMPDPFSTNVFLYPGTHDGDRPLGNFGAPVQLASNKNRIAISAADLTADGAPDLVTTDFFGANVSAFVGRTSLAFTPLSRPVVPFVGGAASADDIAFVDDAGGPFRERGAIGVRRVSGAGDVLAGIEGTRAVDGGGDLTALLRAQRVLVGPARPLAAPVFATGDVRLVRVPDPSAPGETRFALTPRFGPRVDGAGGSGGAARAGLDLDDAAAPRGIIVDVPMLSGRSASGAVRVLLGVPRYRTDGAGLLPKRADGTDVIDVHYDWLDVPAGDVDDTGALGKRFTVVGRSVRVLTDELGVIAVFDGT